MKPVETKHVYNLKPGDTLMRTSTKEFCQIKSIAESHVTYSQMYYFIGFVIQGRGSLRHHFKSDPQGLIQLYNKDGKLCK